MPTWEPQPFWLGKDVYIIGGGPSLEMFDWSLLEGRRAIGCNNAYMLGHRICTMCIFSDQDWFEANCKGLKAYKGLVITNREEVFNNQKHWILYMPRDKAGLYHDRLGWNGNTGASALNLALILGAKRVFLLGFDMRLSNEGRPNWHQHVIRSPRTEVYLNMLGGFNTIKIHWEKKFSDREIWNVTNDSELKVFPTVSPEEHFGCRTELQKL